MEFPVDYENRNNILIKYYNITINSSIAKICRILKQFYSFSFSDFWSSLNV